MSTIDYVVLIGYFAAVAIIGAWAGKRGRDSSSDYFLGGRGIGWLAIGASLFASNISAEHFIGLAGSGAASGLAVGQFEWLACLVLLLLGWLFVPYYLKTRVFTMPEFLLKRYGSACRSYLSAVSLVAYVFTKISVAVYAGALVLQTMLGWNLWVGAIALIVATGLYTVAGGLRAVIYTEFMQCFVLLAGAGLLTWLALQQAGGVHVLAEQLPAGHLSVWRSASHPDFPWTGILFGAPILGVWYWCTDQMIVQRTLAAGSTADARRATLLAGYLKILPVFVLVLPGLAGRLLLPDTPPNQIYGAMVQQLLPAGIRGLVLAGLLAALMSSLSAVFNSASTLVVMDFYQRFRPSAGERELVRAGQVSTAVLVVVGLAWLPFIGVMSDQLYVYLQAVQAYIAPPIAAVFLLGILDRRANSTAALTTLLVGLTTGAGRFVAELAVRAQWSSASVLQAIAEVNFLHFAALSFALSVLLVVVVSRLGAPPEAAQIEAVTRSPRALTSAGLVDPKQRVDATLSILLVAVLLCLWFAFSPLVV